MPNTVFKASYSTVTVLGMINQFHGIADLTYDLHPETTINTKRNVFPNETPTKTPLIKYFGIGINGYYNVDDGNLSQPYYPLATNMDLYQPIPFRIVPVDNDITDKTKYRMRTRITVNGQDYFAYWLKLIEWPNTHVQLTQVDPQGNESTYNLDPSNLNPTPSQLTTPDVEDGDNDTLKISIEGKCIITGAEVVEAINVLYGGDLRRARVSEFGIYTGEDRPMNGDDGQGGTITYTESIYTQLAAHRCTTGTELSDTSSYHEETIKFVNSNIVLL